MGRDLKTGTGNSKWNFFFKLLPKTYALYLFSDSAIHKPYFIFESLIICKISHSRKSQPCENLKDFFKKYSMAFNSTLNLYAKGKLVNHICNRAID